jgi:hypothetical protein
LSANPGLDPSSLATALAQAVLDCDHERARKLADELRALEADEAASARLRLVP